MTLFIGPIGNNGGPAIKNRLLLKYLSDSSQLKICNTHNRSIINFSKNILTLIFSRDEQVIIAVSKNGRSVLYPIIYMKKIMNPKLKFSTVCIGGTIIQDALSHPKSILKALSKADVITVETKKQKREFEEKTQLENVHYMPNYKELRASIPSSSPNFTEENLRFVFLSSVRNVKGVATMIEVFMRILDEHPCASLDIYGPIRKDFDMDVLNQIKEVNQINYRGEVANDQVVDTLSLYNIFLFPTEYIGEGFPAVLIEAYIAGLVVIGSDMNFNTELIRNDINGWIFPTGDKEQFKSVLLNCFDKVDKLEEISINNKKYAADFDAKKVIENYRVALRKMEWKI